MLPATISRHYLISIKCILLLIVAALPFSAVAQEVRSSTPDSLLKALPRAKDDTNKVNLLKNISSSYRSDNKEAIKYGLMALELAERLKWEKGIAESENNLGSCYADVPDFPRALDYYFKALKIFEETRNKDGESRALTNIGTVYTSQNNYAKAEEYMLAALKMCREMGDKLGLAITMQNLGNMYVGAKKDSLGQDYNLKAYELYKELRDTMEMASTLINMGAVYSGKNEQLKALDQVLMALKLAEQLRDARLLAVTKGDIGGIYLEIARDTTGKYRTEYKNDGQTGGNILRQSSKAEYLKQAVSYTKEAINTCKEIGFLDPLLQFNICLSEAYELLGNDQAALESYREYVTMRDSFYSTDNKIKLAKLSTQREAELKEKQIELNKLGEKRKENERAWFSLSLALLTAIIIVVTRNYKQQQKANKEKAGLLQQKDMLMREIHHRVRNNLQVIGTLLDLQLVGMTDEHAKEIMTESSTRVRSISLIHQQLYQENNISSIEFSKFAADLMNQITSVLSKTGQNIVLHNELTETVLDVDTAVPLGLMLNELITNSYKYAFGGANQGSITIALKNMNGSYQLVYKDSGPGMPADYNIKKSGSLGMKLLHSLSKQIGGRFTYHETGKFFTITFTDETGRKLID